MFEHIRQSLNDLMERATKPEDRRDVVSRMRDTLVQAKLGVEDLRSGLATTRARIEVERKELETARRRKALAEGIQDQETVALAAKYEAHHAERLDVLTAKLEAQEREVAMGERELEDMRAEFKRHAIGAVPPESTAGVMSGPLAGETGESAREELDAMARAQARSAAAEDAERRLEELKRRMGKSQ